MNMDRICWLCKNIVGISLFVIGYAMLGAFTVTDGQIWAHWMGMLP